MCKVIWVLFSYITVTKRHNWNVFSSRDFFFSFLPFLPPASFSPRASCRELLFFFLPHHIKLFNCKVHCNEAGPSNLRKWVFISSNVTLGFFLSSFFDATIFFPPISIYKLLFFSYSAEKFFFYVQNYQNFNVLEF